MARALTPDQAAHARQRDLAAIAARRALDPERARIHDLEVELRRPLAADLEGDALVEAEAQRAAARAEVDAWRRAQLARKGAP